MNNNNAASGRDNNGVFMLSVSRVFIVVVFSILLSSEAFAQFEPGFDDQPGGGGGSNYQVDLQPIVEWQKRQTSDQRLTAYGNDLLGDSIDRHLGTLSFQQTDVSLPGNSNLEVAIRRRLTQGENYREDVAVEFADWELVTPKISAIVTTSHGWAGQRCSGTWAQNFPWIYTGSQQFTSKDYTNGVTMDIPGQDSQAVLKPNPVSNPSGQSYTVGEWKFSCTTATDGKQGFIGHAPNGNIYYFKKVLIRNYNRLGFAKKSSVTMKRNKVILAATEVRDVHGNWVKYDYTGDRLTKIHSNDERQITLSYSNNLISSISANGRTWDYIYRNTTYQKPEWHVRYASQVQRKILSRVTRPDNLQWQFNTDAMQADPSPTSRSCPRYSHSVSMIHPNGVSGQFIIHDIEHRQAYKTFVAVTNDCLEAHTFEPYLPSNSGPHYSDPYQIATTRAFAVTSKTLTGEDIPSATWSFAYEQENPCIGLVSGFCASYNPNQYYPNGVDSPWSIQSPAYNYWTAPGSHYWTQNGTFYTSDAAYSGHDAMNFTNWTKVTSPDGNVITHYHHWAREELFGGKEIKRTIEDSNGTVLETVDFTYTQLGCNGTLPIFSSANVKSTHCPTHKTKTAQYRDGDTYVSEAQYSMNPANSTYSYGRPTQTKVYSNVSTTPRVTTTTYEHNTTKWILGLPKSVKRTDGLEVASYNYDSLGQRTREDRYGQLYNRFSYHSDGTLYWVGDALGRNSYLEFWKRGTPIQIKRPDNSLLYRTVDNNGWMMSSKDAMGRTTTYNRDNMGRLTLINPPGSWANTSIAYNFSGGGAVQTINKGQSRETITYDSLFRPILERTQALDTGWSSYVNTKYNGLGQVTFKSQPSTSYAETKGVDYTYDGLGRAKTIRENVAPYATTTHGYYGAHTHRVTDPSGAFTQYYSTGYGGPGDTDYRAIYKYSSASAPLQYTYLYKNVHGQLTRLRQWGAQSGYSPDKSQYFYYDSQQRLCNHYVPEHGATKYQYNAAGEMTAYAKGQVNNSNYCGGTLPNISAKVSQSYDLLGRPTLTNFTDPATDDITRTYDANSNLKTVNRGGVNWAYHYNDLNMLTHETLAIDGKSFPLTYSYNNAGHLTQRTYPTGRPAVYAPDGLGRATGMTGWGHTYASNMTYHASGAMTGMTYGNGQVYTKTLNDRLLPQRLLSVKGASKGIDQTFTYNARGKVISMIDGAVSGNNRSYGYDGLGQVISASGPWGTGSFKYDSLGNLRQKKLGSRTVNLSYDTRNRVSSYTDTAGPNKGVTYDERGNVHWNGGVRLVHDYSEQPTLFRTPEGVYGEYVYDGNLKRVKSMVNGKTIYNVYDASGKLVHIEDQNPLDGGAAERTDYLSAGGMPIVRMVLGQAFIYQHSDHLGSTVATTGATGSIITRERYTPFGETMDNPNNLKDQAGFTGHIKDSATGLNYMQARYYDPVIGRFLSVDPVTFLDTGDPRYFNRYSYSANDPINYVDANGECFGPVAAACGAVAAAAATGAAVGVAIEAVVIGATGGNPFDIEANKGRYAVAGVIGALSGGVGGGAVKGAVSLAPSLGGKTATQGVIGGAVASGTADASSQVANGTAITELDGGSIAKSTVIGGFTGGAITKAAQGGKAAGDAAQGLSRPSVSALESGRSTGVSVGMSTVHSNTTLGSAAGTATAVGIPAAKEVLEDRRQ